MKSFTIGKLARAAGVGVETVRYYQRRHLLPVPRRAASGAFRHYAPQHVERLRFIKRARELGFSLAEVAALLKLNDGKQAGGVRTVAAARLDQIRRKVDDLTRIADALQHLIRGAPTGQVKACIIEALTRPAEHRTRKPRVAD